MILHVLLLSVPPGGVLGAIWTWPILPYLTPNSGVFPHFDAALQTVVVNVLNPGGEY